MIGQTVSHYRVVGKLGVGGMGVVYDAEDQRLPRRVALKFLSDELADDPDATRRLRREAQTIALLNHPNICTIYDVDDFDGRPFIAMERLDGTTLKLYMARQDAGHAEIVDIAAADHRGPGGCSRQGRHPPRYQAGQHFHWRSRHVKVLDFGLARRLPTPDDSAVGMEGSTIPGRPLGTASYMAPERILQTAARRAQRSVFAGRRHLRDGDGEAPIHGRLPVGDGDEHSRKRPDSADETFARSAEGAGTDRRQASRQTA